MILKNYQKTAIDKLVKTNKILLEKDGNHICVLKAPTGSGKTIIASEFLDQLIKENLTTKYAFIWISGYNLHKQSRGKLQNYLESSRFTFSYLEDIRQNIFKENEIVFVNWHSLTKQDKNGEFINVFMRDNEEERNLTNFIQNTKDRGREIILIVDESHYHYWSKNSQELIQDVIQPKLTLEISATPKLVPTNEELEYNEAGQITIRFVDVVAEGMIKKCILINPEIGSYRTFTDVADEAIIAAALEKQKELKETFEKLGKKINPLVLIQLPSQGEATSALDKSKLEQIERILKEKFSITTDNQKLGIWLSERKDNKDQIEENDNKTIVLIFKQAIALGWDCPRAHILVMFRDIKSITFEIQTVGRILRMPEAMHYKNEILNQGYVYTNLSKLDIAQDDENKGYFKIKRANRKNDYKQVELPSTYLSRLDYGDLTLEFRKIFIQELNNYFGIIETDTQEKAKEKADKKLELLPNELQQAIISNEIIEKIDEVKSIVGDVINFPNTEYDIKYKYEYYAKACSLPYAPVRSHTKIQQGFYDWFDNYLGYKNQSRLEIQKIVVCSDNNQKIFKEVIETAKEKFKEVKKRKLEQNRAQNKYLWDVPENDYYNELNEEINSNNYAMDKCYLKITRTAPERAFETLINDNKFIKWWFKNGTEKEIYFSIPYRHTEEDILHSFYPDYIVQYADGTTGIYELKAGITLTQPETAMKSDALQAYIKQEKSKGRKLKGGIINSRKNGLFIFEGEKFNLNVSDQNWKRFETN